ncbi:hypothetical protein OROGR_001753 [Orobanche gracilis]
MTMGGRSGLGFEGLYSLIMKWRLVQQPTRWRQFLIKDGLRVHPTHRATKDEVRMGGNWPRSPGIVNRRCNLKGKKLDSDDKMGCSWSEICFQQGIRWPRVELIPPTRL